MFVGYGGSNSVSEVAVLFSIVYLSIQYLYGMRLLTFSHARECE